MAQFGSALEWGSRGRKFKSSYPDQQSLSRRHYCLYMGLERVSEHASLRISKIHKNGKYHFTHGNNAMKSRFNKIFNIAKVLFLFGLVFLIVFIIVNGTESDQPVSDAPLAINVGNFGVNPTWLAGADNKDATTIYAAGDLGSSDGKLETAYNLYRLSLERLAMVDKYASRAAGEMTFSMDKLSAGGQTRTCIIRNFEKLGTPTLNPNQKYKYDYHNYVVFLGATEGTSSFIKVALEAANNKAIREYSDGTTIYTSTGISPSINSEEATANWDTKVSETAATASPSFRYYEDGELREISNFVINPDTIDGSSVDITQRLVDGCAYYDISFDLICNVGDAQKIGSATYYEAQATMSTTSGLALEYTSVSISMTICENGYMTHFSNTSTSTVTFGAGVMSLPGTSSIKFSEAYSYDPKEVAVVDYRA